MSTPSTLSDAPSLESFSWGPHSVGATLTINPKLDLSTLPDFLSFDVETDGTDKQNFVGIAFCPSLDTVWYFTELNSQVIRLLNGCKLIGHNLKSDLHFLHDAGCNVPLANVFADTNIMSYVKDSSRRKHGLKLLAKEVFNHVWPDYEAMTDNHKVSLALQSPEKVGSYCGRDALETLRLFFHFLTIMNEAEKRLHFQLEIPQCRILFQRECIGIKIDKAYVEELKAMMEPEQDHLEALLIQKAVELGFKHQLKKKVVEARQFNPNSPDQAVTFFNLLGHEVDSAKAEVRESIMDDPNVANFDAYKKLQKLTGTYINGMLELPTLPYVHTTFKQTTTITSRLSSENPNLQNIPVKGVYGPMFRQMFIAREGHIFLDADYSAMDLRTAAHFSQEPVYMEAFLNGRDPHKETAAKIFKKKLADVTKQERNAAKTINFGVLYGEKERKLARQLGLTEDEATSLLNDYWRGMSTLKGWIDRVKWSLKKKGGVSTLMGRFIQYPAIWADNKYVRWEAERQGVNAIISGSNAEILKLADIRLYNMGVLALLPIHDELLVEVEDREEEIQRVVPLMVDALENAVHLSVPLTVDVLKGHTWKAAKDENNKVVLTVGVLA